MIIKKLTYLILILSPGIINSDTLKHNFPTIEGWTIASEIQTFSSDNLWEHINGAADQFIDYDFVQLYTCDLRQGDQIVTIEIYEMGSALSAFGIYAAECPQDIDRIKTGGEGVVVPPGQILLYKDIYYVKIYAYKGDINVSNGTALLNSVAAALLGQNGNPEQLRFLPQKNKIPGSEGFVLKNYLGLAELSRCIFATYSDPDGGTYQLFCILPNSDEPIRLIWNRLTTGKWQTVDNLYKLFSYREVPYKGFIGVHLKKDFILGIAYTDNEKKIIQKLEEYN